jgi:uncharacterized membrane protein
MSTPNDWKIKKCLIFASVFWLSVLALVGGDLIGFNIPILREIICFIFLTYIPGMLILRIVRIHHISASESLFYAVGLSITFIYFVGLFNNFILPLIGVTRPISLFPVTVSLLFFDLVLGFVAYIRDKDFVPSNTINQFSKKDVYIFPYLLLFLLPILAILGTSLVNFYQNNKVLLVLLVFIAAIVTFIAYDRFPQKVYPLAIVMIAASLMLHLSLISPTIFDSDIQKEFYFQNLVIENGYWDPTIPNNYNTCLSIVFLCPFYSLLLNMNSTWIFKIIYPILFSFVPLTLFFIFKEQLEIKKAFLSTFFYLSIPSLFYVMFMHSRQAIATVFFALLIFLVVERKLNPTQKSVLVTIYAISLPLSHYALSYISIFFFCISWIILHIISNSRVRELNLWRHKIFQKIGSISIDNNPFVSNKYLFHKPILGGIIITLLIVFTLSWHLYNTRGTTFNTIVDVGKTIYTGLAEFFEPTTRESMVNVGLGEGFLQAANLDKAFKVLQYLSETLVVIGYFILFLNPRKFKFRIEYFSLTTGAALTLFACIFLPHFSSNLGFIRFYHIIMIFLAPLCIIGGEAILQVTSKVFISFYIHIERWFKKVQLSSSSDSVQCLEPQMFQINRSNNKRSSFPSYLTTLAMVVIIPYFLFNLGFFYSFSRHQSSIALGPYKKDWYALFNQKEVDAANWFSKKIPKDFTVTADVSGNALLFQHLYGYTRGISFLGEVPNNSFIFLRTWNIAHKEVLVPAYQGVTHVYVPVSLMNRPALAERFNNSSVIYSNGGSKILAPLISEMKRTNE